MRAGAELLCTHLRTLENSGQPIPREWSMWWLEHKALDDKYKEYR